MILLELSVIWSKWVVVCHGLEEAIVDMHLSSLEAKLVGVSFTDLFALVLQKIEKSLQYSWHLDDVTHAKFHDWLFPLLRH